MNITKYTMKFALFVFLQLILSCSADNEQENFVVNTMVEFKLSDDQGNDLLNPKNPNAYEESQIRLFYSSNDALVEVYDPLMDHPRNFLIYPHENEYRIRIFLNNDSNEERPVTVIQWSATNQDVLKAEIRRTSNAELIQTIWLNETLIWDTSHHTEPYFELVK
ncbi:hypothetical protein [Robertkochia solimangrovi]|uniref:hypothetical protein n=1 Tax=Robertkochia solimangrovi TaxID=2213046 RepID=UPI00117CCAB4|nr:hypothetical protein [Robertkochia solimangrovi]TRZ41639.1 hypothetical protein DMZ48_16660 [Robertkochia solimangrovi]